MGWWRGARGGGMADASDRVSLAGWHARLRKGSSEFAGLVEVSAATDGCERVCGGPLVHVSSANAAGGLGSRAILSLQRRGSAWTLRKTLFFSRGGRVRRWRYLRGSGFLCAAARGILAESLRTAVRVVPGDVLRHGAAPRKSAALYLWRMDWPARFEAHNHFGDSGPLFSCVPETTEM